MSFVLYFNTIKFHSDERKIHNFIEKGNGYAMCYVLCIFWVVHMSNGTNKYFVCISLFNHCRLLVPSSRLKWMVHGVRNAHGILQTRIHSHVTQNAFECIRQLCENCLLFCIYKWKMLDLCGMTLHYARHLNDNELFVCKPLQTKSKFPELNITDMQVWMLIMFS